MSLQNTNKEDLFELAKILSHQTDFQEILRLVALKSSQLLRADQALILMVNPDTRETIKTVIKNGKSTEQDNHREIHTNIGGWIIHYKKSFLSKDIHKDKIFSKGIFDNVDVKSVIGVPLIVENIIIGTLILLYKKSSDSVRSEAVELLENIAAISTPFLRNVQKIRQYFDTTISESTLIQKYKTTGLIGKDSKYIELLHAIEAVAKCDARVLLDGKTGTGKELIARAIHHFSSRAESPFIAIDCGAISESLVESELFGHKRGAFTGANSDRPGMFVEANGGTLFLDEINNLPYDMQSKLLRVLQDGEVRPIGSDKSVKTDIRIITASSMPLKSLVDQDKFRQDLFFRLSVYPIYIPDLNERQEDIAPIANHFLAFYAKRQNKKAANFHEEVIDFIKQRNWQGNIRELENFVERLVTISPQNALEIAVESFPADLKEEFHQLSEKRLSRNYEVSLKEKVREYEAELIKATLIKCNWNQSETARRLKTSEKNIRYKMNQLNIKK